jgi:hypothetical protein
VASITTLVPTGNVLMGFAFILMQNKDVFSQSKYDIGLTHVIQHKINTGNAAAIKQAPRRIPLAQRKEVEDEIDKMLDNNVIVPRLIILNGSPSALVTHKVFAISRPLV